MRVANQSPRERWHHRLGRIRRRPFPKDTADGRAAERMRRISLSVLASVASRFVTTAITLLSVPLTIGYLGAERYGLWITASTTIGMLSFADLGIGNGLLTRIAEADGRGDREEMRTLVSSAFALLVSVAAVLSFALLAIAPHVDWSRLLNLRTSAARVEAPAVVLALGLITFISMPLSVVTQVRNGLQSGYKSTLWSMAGATLSLLALFVATHLRSGLLGLVLALASMPVLVLAVNFCWYFFRANPVLRPRLVAADWTRAWGLLRIGVQFVTLQLSVSFLLLSDNIVIANVLGAEAVSELAVPVKLFSMASLPVLLVTGPLWPAFGEARARGDAKWITVALRVSMFGGVVTALLVAMPLLALGTPLVRYWTRGVVAPGAAILLPLAVWSLFYAWGVVVAAFLNGSGSILPQAAAAASTALVAFPLKWLLVSRLGPSGAVWATILAYALFTFIPLSIVVRDITRRISLERSP